jgi:hypothetical protein
MFIIHDSYVNKGHTRYRRGLKMKMKMKKNTNGNLRTWVCPICV